MQSGYWVIRKYCAGPVGETFKYWVPGKKPDRLTQRAKQAIKKQEKNAQNAVRTMARLLNENFRAGDLLFGLDYDEVALRKMEGSGQGGGEEINRLRQAARKELQRAIKRIRYHAGKQGIPLKYIAITSDLNGKTGEQVRVHHHLVVNAEAKALFEKNWKAGGVNFRKLSAQPDYTSIAVYLLAQVRPENNEKKYTTSRDTLVRPEPKDRIARNESVIRAPKGAVLLDSGKNIPGQCQYIRYVLPEQARRAELELKNGCTVVRTVEGHQRRRKVPGHERDQTGEDEEGEADGI